MQPQLNRQLYGLLNSTGAATQKANLVLGFTKGRSESTADLTDAEAKEMIAYLQRQQTPDDPANKMRRKFLAFAHEMRWHNPGTKNLNMQHVNDWCIKYSYLHKPLNDYTIKELPALISQMEQVYKHFLKTL